jgi:tripartite-type tricarboxylate transporter receptor subunit TctC
MTARRAFKSATVSLVALGLLGLSLSGGSAGASSTAKSAPAGFYARKTLTLLVPNAPGGDMDVTARLIAPYLRKALGASAIRILDVKGAGGVIGLNRLWSSPNNGFTIGYTSMPTVIMTSLLNGSSVKYDASKFVYIGRASTAPRVLVVSSKSGIKNIAGLKAASKVTMSIQGFDDDFYTQAAIASSLGINVRFISGFDSLAAETVSVSNGATTGLESSLAAESSVITAGLVKPILMLSNSPVKGFESIPTWISIVPEAGKPLAEAFQSLILLGRSFFAPPGVPTAAVTALSDALKTALQDTDLKRRLIKAEVPPVYMSGADEGAAVADIWKSLQSTLAPLKDAKAQVEGK